jgi:uncharacterized surface protein with fasciclin (FAS1) repeats
MPELKKLASLIQVANLTGFLNESSGLTLLAPSNTVLNGMDVTNATLAQDLVLSHVFMGILYSDDFNTTSVESLNHHKYQVRTVQAQIEVGSALIVDYDILASNGVIQGIDRLVG